jgi:threonylcarbamoyladenosine tRNA methylthiotransferase MtaB
MKFAVVTFGCRVNQADSFALERSLRAAGARAAPIEAADVVVVNSCSVTATADQGTRQAIRRIARTNAGARIVATGCYASRAAEEVAALPGVVAVVPNMEKEALAERILDTVEPTTAVRFGSGDGACGAAIRPGERGRTAYTLRVQTGCDEACAYCIIPSTRGRGRSVPLPRVLDEVDQAVEAGYREMQLTGVHLGSYGRDLTPPSSLVALLQALAAHPSDVLIRMSSLEPMDCTAEVVELATTSGRFAPHFHLPLQHASDAVLQRMRRPYTAAGYRAVVTDIRERLPHAAIGSDLVVGFPGETDADAAATLGFLEESPLTYLHVFPYSDRPGTEASGMSGKVDGRCIRERARAVREAGAALVERFRAAQVGTVRPGLTLAQAGGTVVLTDNYLRVRVPVERPENERVRVRITAAGETLAGELVASAV